MTRETVIPRSSAAHRVPPLQGGDTLNAREFERRYDATPGLRKAELVKGEVFVPPPVSDEDHAAPQFDLIGWLAMYRFATPGVAGGDNGTLRLDTENRPQPDAYLRILPECGGQARRDADGYITSGPELVAEVAATSASYDLNPKLEVYRRHKVREYIVWRVFDNTVDWFILRGRRYEPLDPAPDRVLRSKIFPGLWLDAAALIGNDILAFLRWAQAGLASPEHAAFVARLHEAASRRAGRGGAGRP